MLKRPQSVKSQVDGGEHQQACDGWDLFRKTKISMVPVRRYISHVDADYKRNKVTVCANLSNIYNSFIVRYGRPGPGVNNYFDIEKWLSKFGPIDNQDKDLKRINTVTVIENASTTQPASKGGDST